MAKADIAARMDEALRPLRLLNIGTEVINEISGARAKHGPNDRWPDGTGPDQSIGDGLDDHLKQGCRLEWLLNEDLAILAKGRTDFAAKHGTLTREMILTEEWAEAMAEEDPAKLRAELIQVAAMAMDWVADIDVRGREA